MLSPYLTLRDHLILYTPAPATSDPHGLNLWAGTGYRSATTDPAAVIVARLGTATGR